MAVSIFLFFSDIDKSELKAFFESNSSQIYFIFYENFITLESNLKQKGKNEHCCVSLIFAGQPPASSLA